MSDQDHNDPELKSLQLADGRARDAFEKVVELYYQCNGYITSNNKWFKINKKDYTDIDLVVINGKEIHIVNITTNLNGKTVEDKINVKDGKRKEGLITHFKKSQEAFEKNYKSLYDQANDIVSVIAFINGSPSIKKKIKKESNIRLLAADNIFKAFAMEFETYVKPTDRAAVKFESKYKLEDEILQVMQWCYAFFVEKKK